MRLQRRKNQAVGGKISVEIACVKPGKEAGINVKEHIERVAQELLPELPEAFGNPDARVGHTRTNGTICGYRSGFLVDAKRHIVTALIFVTLNVGEAPTVVRALEKHHSIFGRYPKRLGLDSAFDRDVHYRTFFCSPSK